MKNFQNTGRTDRILRLVLALFFAVASYYTHGWARLVLLILTTIMLISGLSGFTLPYKLLGISTKKK